MPCSRPGDLATAIPMYIKQDYENRELLILLDANIDPIDAKKYTREELGIWCWNERSSSLGDKRNQLCKAATGDIIVHMDSDDTYASDWITRSVEALTANKADMTGLNRMYLASPTLAWFYKYSGSQPYVCGATMCYWKSRWQKFPFRNLGEGEDTAFCYPGGRIIAHNYIDGFIARITGHNTASHKAVKMIPQIDYSQLPIVK